MKQLLFIYNPHAGKGMAAKELAPVLDVFTKAGWLVTTYPTQCKGDAPRVAAEMGPDFDRVVCAGGDGTLSETVAGLMKLENPPVLGYIPIGTTNDCAVTLNLPRSPKQAAAIAAGEGVVKATDIGFFNGTPFVYVAAFGAFTQVAYATPQDLKNTFGHLAYVMSGIASLPNISPRRLKVEYDDGELEASFLYGMVGNTVSVAGMHLPKNEAVVLDDGLFEVDLVRATTDITQVTDGLTTLLDQNPPSAGARHHFKTSKITFTFDEEVPWTLDGEFGGKLKVCVVENHRQALRIVYGK